MADVFISYARDNQAFAERLAEALTAEGYDVWWDNRLLPHHAFAEAIETELRGARAVIVVWSKAATHSQWVRAEADLSRGQGKLVQVAAEPCDIPLPFNQIQTVQLGGWSGDSGDANWRKVLASVAALTGRTVEASLTGERRAIAMAERVRDPRTVRRWSMIGALAAALLIAVAGFVYWGALRRPPAPTEAARVAIMPFRAIGDSARARTLAAGLGERVLGTLSENHVPVVAHDDAASLTGADRAARLKAMNVALLLSGSVEETDDQLHMRVQIDNPARSVTLWSGALDSPADQAEQAQRRMATTTANVVACSTRAIAPGAGLTDPDLLRRYLRACDLFTNQGDATGAADTFELLSDLRKVTAGAPRFAAAHSDLAKFDAYLARFMNDDQAAQMRAEAAREATKALDLDARSPDAWLARAMILPPHQYLERERLLRKGVEVDPDWPHTNGFLAQFLWSVGRIEEARVYFARAAAADLEIDWRPGEADFNCERGQTEAGIEVLKRQLVNNPKDVWSPHWLMGCYIAAHRYAEARSVLQAIKPAPDYAAAFSAALTAAETRKPADLARARTLLLALPTGSRNDDPGPVGAANLLATLGLVDDAFKSLDGFNGFPALLFTKSAAPLQRDPRFMPLMVRLGIAQYWKASGKWPDFCAEPGLPYNCKSAVR